MSSYTLTHIHAHTSGRVDMRVEIPHLVSNQVELMFHRFYPEVDFPGAAEVLIVCVCACDVVLLGKGVVIFIHLSKHRLIWRTSWSDAWRQMRLKASLTYKGTCCCTRTRLRVQRMDSDSDIVEQDTHEIKIRLFFFSV